MISLLFTAIVFLIVASVVLYAVRLLLGSLPGGPQPIHNAFYALIVLILLVVFLSEIGWIGPAHGWRTMR